MALTPVLCSNLVAAGVVIALTVHCLEYGVGMRVLQRLHQDTHPKAQANVQSAAWEVRSQYYVKFCRYLIHFVAISMFLVYPQHCLESILHWSLAACGVLGCLGATPCVPKRLATCPSAEPESHQCHSLWSISNFQSWLHGDAAGRRYFNHLEHISNYHSRVDRSDFCWPIHCCPRPVLAFLNRYLDLLHAIWWR